ncbi:hypothetical protein IMZ08_17425 [Bacillus luteolus]|uniref:Uncharacterized protein n=1 Tax=Litchfieldia luteola TaxID=682179 RepID=A0ABR9QMT0_9BACI|nr:hypothetical protein [Cytobacillus luteolus]MBE4909818.1 hypothetical protein [Cytobacillus luteolus]MBP1942633.1 hypothetical protein [Cytobacillus luteolus]
MRIIVYIGSSLMALGGLIVLGNIMYEYLASGELKVGLLGMGIIPIMGAILLVIGRHFSEKKS